MIFSETIAGASLCAPDPSPPPPELPDPPEPPEFPADPPVLRLPDPLIDFWPAAAVEEVPVVIAASPVDSPGAGAPLDAGTALDAGAPLDTGAADSGAAEELDAPLISGGELTGAPSGADVTATEALTMPLRGEAEPDAVV